MSIKLGTTDIAGLALNKQCNVNNLLEARWFDHILNNVEWLRADTFSWQSGVAYVSAYSHLVDDIFGKSLSSETIGSTTISFYRADDGHKICPADQASAVADIYTETGIAWYFILDTENTQFKLPRTKFGFEGLRTNVGDPISESLPNIKGQHAGIYNSIGQDGALYGAYGAGNPEGSGCSSSTSATLYLDASRSSSTYQDNAPVQERATQMYLYFFVGNFTRTATEQTAGLNSEQLNNKVDLSTCVPAHVVIDTYQSGTSWYRIYSDGWCEQGGYVSEQTRNDAYPVALVKTYADTNYSLITSKQIVTSVTSNIAAYSLYTKSKTVSGFTVAVDLNVCCYWFTAGYLAEGQYNA